MSLERFRKDAEAPVRSYNAGDKKARTRVSRYFDGRERLPLGAAQLVVARDQGLASWPALVRGGGAGQADLIRAALAGDVERLRDLLPVMSPGRTLLMDVVSHPNQLDAQRFASCVELLLDARCDPNAAVQYKGTSLPVLIFAREHGHAAVERLLLARGADLARVPAVSVRVAARSCAPINDADDRCRPRAPRAAAADRGRAHLRGG